MSALVDKRQASKLNRCVGQICKLTAVLGRMKCGNTGLLKIAVMRNHVFLNSESVMGQYFKKIIKMNY